MGDNGENRRIRLSGFKGSYLHTLDQKGRLNIPAKYRRSPGMAENYTIIRGLNNCLYVFPEDEWVKVEEELKTRTKTDPNALYYLRITLANAADVQVDRQGRITIPANLIKTAKFNKEVLVNGRLDRMELWNPDEFEKFKDEFSESYEEVAKKILI